MGVLRRAPAAAAAAAAVAGCYAPELADCTVTCADGAACVAGQVCDADGWCVAPAHAGACADLRRRVDAAVPDGGLDAAAPDGGADAAVPDGGLDAAAPDGGIDAAVLDGGLDAAPPPTTTLRLVVEGRGRVVGDAAGVTCDGAPNQPGDCAFTVAAGQPITLLAVETHHRWELDRWTAGCSGSSRTCTITPAAPATLVGVRFEED